METRLRSAGIWISGGQILLESLLDREIWGIPGGSVESGESIEDACVREYREEIGLEIECGRLTIVHENFWNDDGRVIREYGFYFIISPTADLSGSPNIVSLEGSLQFRWHSLTDLQYIQFVPLALRDYLPDLPGHTLFVSTREGSD